VRFFFIAAFSVPMPWVRRSVADMRKYSRILETEGDFVNGKRHPAHAAYCAALKELRLYAGELGLTPARRAVGNKIKGEFKHDLDDWEGLLA
jgi:phage terminase small subunit